MDGDCSREIKRHLILGKEAMPNLDSVLKSREITLLTFVHVVKAIVFLVVVYGCESWVIKKVEHRRTDTFECWTLQSPLDNKEIKPVNPKGNQPSVFIRTYAAASILWPPDTQSRLIGKDPDAGKD